MINSILFPIGDFSPDKYLRVPLNSRFLKHTNIQNTNLIKELFSILGDKHYRSKKQRQELVLRSWEQQWQFKRVARANLIEKKTLL